MGNVKEVQKCKLIILRIMFLKNVKEVGKTLSIIGGDLECMQIGWKILKHHFISVTVFGNHKKRMRKVFFIDILPILFSV